MKSSPSTPVLPFMLRVIEPAQRAISRSQLLDDVTMDEPFLPRIVENRETATLSGVTRHTRVAQETTDDD